MLQSFQYFSWCPETIFKPFHYEFMIRFEKRHLCNGDFKLKHCNLLLVKKINRKEQDLRTESSGFLFFIDLWRKQFTRLYIKKSDNPKKNFLLSSSRKNNSIKVFVKKWGSKDFSILHTAYSIQSTTNIQSTRCQLNAFQVYRCSTSHYETKIYISDFRNNFFDCSLEPLLLEKSKLSQDYALIPELFFRGYLKTCRGIRNDQGF